MRHLSIPTSKTCNLYIWTYPKDQKYLIFIKGPYYEHLLNIYSARHLLIFVTFFANNASVPIKVAAWLGSE